MKKGLITAAIVLLVIGGVTGIVMLAVDRLSPKPVSPLAVRPAIARATFADGTRLDVLLHGEGSITEGSRTLPGSGSLLKPVSTGSSTYSFGHLDIETTTVDKVLSSIRYASDCDGDLVLAVRFLDAAGKAIECERHITRGQVKSDDNAGSYRMTKLEPGFPEAVTAPDARPESWPEFIVQLSDGAGGWILGDGPLPVKDDPGHRGAMLFRGWPRTTNPLVFRALRPGSPPVEFTLHQPKPVGAPAPWTPAPLPQSHKDPDFRLTLTKVRAKSVPNHGHYLGPEHEFQTRFADNKREGFRGAKLECELVAVQGALGSSGIQTFAGNHGFGIGYPVPPDESLFRAHYRVERLNAFPQPMAKAMMIADAEIGATGKTINVTSRTSKYSITAITIDHLRTEGSKDVFDIKVEGAWKDSAGRAKAAPVIGSRADLIPLVFLDGATESSGDGAFNSSGERSSMTSGGFEFSGDWFGHLKPGQKLKIGLATQLPPTDVSFTFDRSAIKE